LITLKQRGAGLARLAEATSSLTPPTLANHP
jgi:hypothetical protein